METQKVNELNVIQNVVLTDSIPVLTDEIDNVVDRLTVASLLANSISSDSANNLQIGEDGKLYTKGGTYTAGSGIGIDNQEISVKVFDKSKFTVVGNPVITDDGVVSGFSNGNCVILSSQITQSANSWEIKIPFSYKGTLRKDRWLISGNDYNSNSYIRILSSDKLNYTFLKEDRSNLFQITGTNTLEYNTKYITTAIFTGTEYNFYLTNLETGTTNLDATFSSTEKIVDFNTCALGCRSVNRAYDVPFTDGSIDLPQFSIKVDGIEVFNGTKTIYQALDNFVKTSNLSEINPMIESFVDGSSGYNIWANGYCEQWGHSEQPASTQQNSIVFLKKYKDTNYIITQCGGLSSVITGKYADSFTVDTNSGTQAKYAMDWETRGYLAEGEY